MHHGGRAKVLLTARLVFEYLTAACERADHIIVRAAPVNHSLFSSFIIMLLAASAYLPYALNFLLRVHNLLTKGGTPVFFGSGPAILHYQLVFAR